MSTESFPNPPRDRLRWAVEEGLVIGGILVFWVVVGLLLVLGLSVVAAVVELLQLGSLRILHEFVSRSGAVWAVVTPLASATTGLYGVVRAGTVLIDRYAATRPGAGRGPAQSSVDR